MVKEVVQESIKDESYAAPELGSVSVAVTPVIIWPPMCRLPIKAPYFHNPPAPMMQLKSDPNQPTTSSPATQSRV